MIDFNCPKCGEVLSVPGSLAGKTETCPSCGNVCPVPQPIVAIDLARAFEKIAVPLGKTKNFCIRRKKLVGIIAVNILLLTGLLSWLLPKCLPRPVIRFETPARTPPLPSGKLQPLGTLANFRPVFDDFGARLSKSHTFEDGKRVENYVMDSTKADAAVMLCYNEQNAITSIACFLGSPKDFRTLARTTAFPAIIARLCKDWDHTRTAEMMEGINVCADAFQKKQMALTKEVYNGIEVQITLSEAMGFTFCFSRVQPPSIRTEAWVYEPMCEEEDNKAIGITDIRWRLIDTDAYSGVATVAWQAKVTNRTDQPHMYSVWCSFRDKDNFELASDVQFPVSVKPHRSAVVSKQAMMKASLYKQVVSVEIRVQATL